MKHREAAAKEAGLDDNESALLAIASAGLAATAQMRKVSELAKTVQPTPEDSDEGSPSPDPTEHGSNNVAAAARNATDKATSDAGTPSAPPAKEPPATSMIELEAIWKKHGQKPWRYTPPEVRERFIAMLRRAPCKVEGDARQLLLDVMQGRKSILKAVLYAYAKAKGVKKKHLKAHIRMLHYLSKNYSGPGPGGAPWYVVRPDSDWKNESKRVPDADLKPYEDTVNSDREQENEFVEAALKMSEDLKSDEEQDRLDYYEM